VLCGAGVGAATQPVACSNSPAAACLTSHRPLCCCCRLLLLQDGYFKVPRGERDCGISSDPMVVVVDERFVVPGVAEALRAKHAGLRAA
jgi:hypothetical protein